MVGFIVLRLPMVFVSIVLPAMLEDRTFLNFYDDHIIDVATPARYVTIFGKVPHQDSSSDHKQCAGSLQLYGN